MDHAVGHRLVEERSCFKNVELTRHLPSGRILLASVGFPSDEASLFAFCWPGLRGTRALGGVSSKAERMKVITRKHLGSSLCEYVSCGMMTVRA